MEFPCTGCGACCLMLSDIIKNCDTQANPVIRAAVETFPYKTGPTGACEKLVNGFCSVYDTRPLLCNVKQLGKAIGVDELTWFRANASVCNAVIDQLGIDPSYKIQHF